MTPSKLLIAQRLDEASREIASIVDMMSDYLKDPRWAGVAADMAAAGETAAYWAEVIRTAEQ